MAVFAASPVRPAAIRDTGDGLEYGRWIQLWYAFAQRLDFDIRDFRMNRPIEPILPNSALEAMPRGLQGWLLRAQMSPVGYRVLTAHHVLLKKAGGLGYTFVLFVVVPTLIAALYLALWASREYESEARLTVRSSSESNIMQGLNEALASFSTLGITKTSPQDVFIVADYIRSRTIIQDLEGAKILHEVYSKPSIDFFSRLKRKATLEELWKYWNRKVSAVINTSSNIITVKVQAYTAQEAHRLTELISNRSEALVNEISERSRSDALNRAEAEVQAANKRVLAARQNMLAFRNKSNVINPVESASSIGKTLSELVRDKLALENSKAALANVMDSASPTQRMLQTQIDSLDKQIGQLREQLTSRQQNENVISGQISSFEELQLETQFAEKLLTIAQGAYERARMDQEKQQLYLVAIVRPTVPERPAYPRLSIAIPMIFIVFSVLWAMVSLIVASIRDHLS